LSPFAARGRLGGLAAHRKYGKIIPGSLLLTPQRRGGLKMATAGILTLRAHGFGGALETDLQKAWRLRDKAKIELYAATRRPAHRQCVQGPPCRRCRGIAATTLQRRLAAVSRVASRPQFALAAPVVDRTKTRHLDVEEPRRARPETSISIQRGNIQGDGEEPTT
jgi:hypothetical protein